IVGGLCRGSEARNPRTFGFRWHVQSFQLSAVSFSFGTRKPSIAHRQYGSETKGVRRRMACMSPREMVASSPLAALRMSVKPRDASHTASVEARKEGQRSKPNIMNNAYRLEICNLSAL